MTKLSNHYEKLHVHIADQSPILVPRDGQRSNFDLQSLLSGTWHNPGFGSSVKPTEFRATPIEMLDLPQEIRNFNYIPSEYEREDWYFLERVVPEKAVPNTYVVHGDYLIPLNASYPALISALPHLQEMLALAQLEASKVAQKSERRLGPTDRLMAYLTNIAVNFTPR